LPLLNQLSNADTNQLAFLVGKTADGQIVTSDLAKLPHLLVAGSTGSGKTVFLYSFIVSLLQQFGSDSLSLLLIDPKQTEIMQIFFCKRRVPSV
jgi:DNA segregation ATPase FtsK/SpoIIIE-like protein